MMQQRAFDGYRKRPLDEGVEARIAEHCDRFGIHPLEAVKFFPVLARRQWLKRFLAHVDLFRRTLDVPGDIADLGVFRGLSLFTWANLLEIDCIGDRTKIVYGFDNWTGFTGFSPQDGSPEADVAKTIGGYDPSGHREAVLDALEMFDADRFIPSKPRVVLVDGPIEQRVPAFVAEHPGVRFSLLHFDCDLYAPTKAGLEALWPRLSRGGVAIFDEYGIEEWAGETEAVDEFFARHANGRVRTFDWTNSPAAYVVKD